MFDAERGIGDLDAVARMFDSGLGFGSSGPIIRCRPCRGLSGRRLGIAMPLHNPTRSQPSATLTEVITSGWGMESYFSTGLVAFGGEFVDDLRVDVDLFL